MNKVQKEIMASIYTNASSFQKKEIETWWELVKSREKENEKFIAFSTDYYDTHGYWTPIVRILAEQIKDLEFGINLLTPSEKAKREDEISTIRDKMRLFNGSYIGKFTDQEGKPIVNTLPRGTVNDPEFLASQNPRLEKRLDYPLYKEEEKEIERELKKGKIATKILRLEERIETCGISAIVFSVCGCG